MRNWKPSFQRLALLPPLMSVTEWLILQVIPCQNLVMDMDWLSSALGLGIGMAVVSGLDPRKNNEPFVNQLHLTANGGPASSSADGWATFGLPVIAGLMYRDRLR